MPRDLLVQWFRRFAHLTAAIALVASSRADDPQVLLEIGRDFRETRLFSVGAVRCGEGRPPLLAVSGFSNNGRGDLASLALYDLNESGISLRWQQLRGGDESSSIRTLRIADLNGDGCDELVALGRVGNEETDSRAELQVFEFAGESWRPLAMERWLSGQYTHGYGMDIGDLDGDGRPEIATGGFFRSGERELAELRVWRVVGGQLELIASTSWGSEAGQTRINSVRIGDLGGDGHVSIVTAGRTGQVHQEEGDNLQEADQLIVWRLDSQQLIRRAEYAGALESRSRLRELRLADLDGAPGLELIAVGRQDPPRRRGRGDGSGGGTGGGRGDGTGGGRRGDQPAQLQPLMSVFQLHDTQLERVTEADFGDALGETRDLAVVSNPTGPTQVVTITANDLEPHRNAALDQWEWRDGGLRFQHRRTAVLGDETRARQLLLWDGAETSRILTIGFVDRKGQVLGQILDWGPLQ